MEQTDDSQTPRWPNSHRTDRDALTPLSATRPLPPEIRRFIVHARSEGFTLQSIADTLNERRIPTAQGGKCWMPGTISAVLRSTELDVAV